MIRHPWRRVWILFPALLLTAGLLGWRGVAKETQDTPTRGLRSGNVKDFGARGDGQTDDTAAIQSAIDRSRDGHVDFPRGDYRITRTIEIRLSDRGRGYQRRHALVHLWQRKPERRQCGRNWRPACSRGATIRERT